MREMKGSCWGILLMLLIVLGGQAFGSQESLHRHKHKHPIRIVLNSRANPVLDQVLLRHEELSDSKIYIQLSGKVTEPWDRSRLRAVITAKFLDEHGKELVRESTEVVLRANYPKNKEKKFSIKVQDNPEIVECNIDVKWFEKSSLLKAITME